MALSALDENKSDKIIAHKQSAKNPHPDNVIIAHSPAPVKIAATFISEEGETVARQMRQIQKNLSEKEIARVILGYQSGKSSYELAREYGCNRKTICAQLKKHGIEVSQNKIKSEETVQSIISLYEKGHTIQEVANRHEVSTATINQLLHKNGVLVRSRWDYY